MNANFLVNGRRYKTPCKTVFNAETFTVMFNTCKHIITANVSDKCYFASIDNISLSDIKCDFHFSRNYTKPKEFLSNLYGTLDSFLNTSLPDNEKCTVYKSTDEVLDRILEIVTANTTSEINNKKSEINSMYGITANTSPEISNEYNETKELLAVEQFERLTGTLCKSLFKAIGIEETMRIPIIISNNMVYFNYNGTQYKYNPSQCKVYKKDGRKYQRINWKDFKDDNSSTDQKQDRGRSPPLLLI